MFFFIGAVMTLVQGIEKSF